MTVLLVLAVTVALEIALYWAWRTRIPPKHGPHLRGHQPRRSVFDDPTTIAP